MPRGTGTRTSVWCTSMPTNRSSPRKWISSCPVSGPRLNRTGFCADCGAGAPRTTTLRLGGDPYQSQAARIRWPTAGLWLPFQATRPFAELGTQTGLTAHANRFSPFAGFSMGWMSTELSTELTTTPKRPRTERGGGRDAMVVSVRDGTPRRLEPIRVELQRKGRFFFSSYCVYVAL